MISVLVAILCSCLVWLVRAHRAMRYMPSVVSHGTKNQESSSNPTVHSQTWATTTRLARLSHSATENPLLSGYKLYIFVRAKVCLRLGIANSGTKQPKICPYQDPLWTTMQFGLIHDRQALEDYLDLIIYNISSIIIVSLLFHDWGEIKKEITFYVSTISFFQTADKLSNLIT
jgi:hypothetical protein